MTFSLVRVAGFISGTRLLASEMNTIQNNIAASLDAIGGGSYTMTAPIVFAGDTWTLPATTFEGNVHIDGDVTIENPQTLTVNGDVSFAAASAHGGAATFASTLAVNGDTTLGNAITDALVVAGTLTCAGTTTCNGALVTTGNTTIGNAGADTLTVNASTSFAGSVACTVGLTSNTLIVTGGTALGEDSTDSLTVYATTSFRARVVSTIGCTFPVRRVLVTTPTTTLDAAWLNGNYYRVESLDAECAITLLTANVPTGATIEISTREYTNEVVVWTVSGTVHMRNAAGFIYYAKFCFDGTEWEVVCTVFYGAI